MLTATNVLVRILLAPSCCACSGALTSPLSGPVCDLCWQSVPRITPPSCVRCGDALPGWHPVDPLCARCRHQSSSLTLARSAGRHDGSLRRIVHAFKYGHRRALAHPLARLMREAGADLLAGADGVVPVPLHPWRHWQRGFNQADDLARGCGPPVWRVLRRRRHGPPQAGLPASERHANVRDAFAVRASWRMADRTLRNRRLVLIDDVMTTGATLDACARVLLDAGVRSVGALTVARAAAAPHDPPRPSPHPLPARHR